MSCFPCFSKSRSVDGRKSSRSDSQSSSSLSPTQNTKSKPSAEEEANKDPGNGNIAATSFTFCELAAITMNFHPECLLGEGGFGRVYKGKLESTGQIVAVKQLDRNGAQGNQEFLGEVLMLSLLHHQNLVNLIGYCADGDQRLLVYEFIPMGSLEEHLFDVQPDQKPLDWCTRMQIATGAANGLEYLHEKANPPVIYRDLKSSSILLDEGFQPKLSDFGLARLGPVGDKVNDSSTVMGTYGYCAPEYARNGQLTLKSDVYSFGVVLLELITGRRVIDTTKPIEEQNLVAWAQPKFRDQKKFPELVDPRLNGAYPTTSLNQAVAVAAMCLQEEPMVRPLIADVVMTLSFLADRPAEPSPPRAENPPAPSQEMEPEIKKQDDDAEHQRDVAEAIEWASARENRRSLSEEDSP